MRSANNVALAQCIVREFQDVVLDAIGIRFCWSCQFTPFTCLQTRPHVFLLRDFRKTFALRFAHFRPRSASLTLSAKRRSAKCNQRYVTLCLQVRRQALCKASFFARSKILDVGTAKATVGHFIAQTSPRNVERVFDARQGSQTDVRANDGETAAATIASLHHASLDANAFE